MSKDEPFSGKLAEDPDLDQANEDPTAGSGDSEPEEEEKRLELEVDIASPSACERHITVSVSRPDIERYFDDSFSEMMTDASVPGFRPGRAPRKLVEQRYRKDVQDRVKGNLMMDALTQLSDDYDLTAIGEPDFDFEAVEMPDEGPLTFEFDLEVRPEFELPKWQGLKLKRPSKEITDAEVDERVGEVLENYGQMVPHDGPAENGDYLIATITCKADGREISRHREQQIRVRPVLSFRDGKIEGFDKIATGAKSGDKLDAKLTISNQAPNEAMRGQAVDLTLEVLDVKRVELPEVNSQLLEELGGLESEQELRTRVREQLQRQVEYRQHERARDQISSLLTEAADWELPPKLLRRQSARELERAVLELRRAGFSEEEIRARQNDLRHNSEESTAKALKEHFILERIAEQENLDVTEEDYEREMMLIALQSGESVRRVRAQLQKRGMMDSLRNQIIERKVISLVESKAEFEDAPIEEEPRHQVAAVDLALAGGEAETVTQAAPAAGASSPS